MKKYKGFVAIRKGKIIDLDLKESLLEAWYEDYDPKVKIIPCLIIIKEKKKR